MTAEQIKSAVTAGKRVYWGNEGYEVIKDSLGQYLIIYTPSGYCIGLTHRDGQTLNGKEADFFIK